MNRIVLVFLPISLVAQGAEPLSVRAAMESCANPTLIAVPASDVPSARRTVEVVSCPLPGGASHRVFVDSVLAVTGFTGRAVIDSLRGTREGDPRPYGPYTVHAGRGELLVIDPRHDRAWTGALPALESHLFLLPLSWGDATLSRVPGTLASLGVEVGRPMDQVVAELTPRCDWAAVREIEEVWLPGVTRQQQLDCLGIDWRGARRKLEVVFGDGRLALAWLFSGTAELPRVRGWLREAIGPRADSLPGYERFGDGSVALRHEPPELLLADPETVRRMTTSP